MPRGQERNIAGGEISPYVQQSMQQNKQLATNRLLAATQEAGATKRTAMQEQGATQRAAMQAGTQRAIQAAQLQAEDKRAAEAERAKREDMEFTKSMEGARQEFQAKQAELDRQQQMAIIQGDRKLQKEIEDKREALRRFNIEMNLDANERTTNAMLSIIKGGLKRESSIEKAKTVLQQESEKFDKDKEVYNKIKERVADNILNDKRMDLPVVGEPETKAVPAGAPGGFSSGFMRVRAGGIKPGTQADPMGVLQDQIDKFGGNISIETLDSGKIKELEDQIQKGDVKGGDINATLGVIEGMVSAVKNKREVANKESKDFDFWNQQKMQLDQMRDNLEGLANSKKKIAGSETETVGSRVQYALGTVYNSSLGGRAARFRDMVGGDFGKVFDEMTKPLEVPKMYAISGDMNKYDIELRTWMNNYMKSRYPSLGGNSVATNLQPEIPEDVTVMGGNE